MTAYPRAAFEIGDGLRGEEGEEVKQYTLTVDDVMALHPCHVYPRSRVVALSAGRERLTASDIHALAIPAPDRLWVLLQMAPREVWMPAIWAAVERSICAASRALDRAGRAEWAERLAHMHPIVGTESCQAAIPVLREISACAAAACAAAAYAAAYAAVSLRVSYSTNPTAHTTTHCIDYARLIVLGVYPGTRQERRRS